jgi:hypothetical protein
MFLAEKINRPVGQFDQRVFGLLHLFRCGILSSAETASFSLGRGSNDLFLVALFLGNRLDHPTDSGDKSDENAQNCEGNIQG